MDNKLIYSLPKKINQTPFLSIYLATYNKGKFISRIIRSIQNQSFKDLEIIFVDDGSTDDTVDVIKEFKDKDPRIRIINNKINKGVMYSRLNEIVNRKIHYDSRSR